MLVTEIYHKNYRNDTKICFFTQCVCIKISVKYSVSMLYNWQFQLMKSLNGRSPLGQFLKRKCREEGTKMSSATKSFRIDDLLKGRNEGGDKEQQRVTEIEGDSSIVPNSGAKERYLGSHGNSQLPLSAAPIDYSRPRPCNEKSPGVKSLCLGDEAQAPGGIVNGTTDVFHGHVLSSVLVGNSVANNSLQFGSESDIGSNHQSYQALLTMEAHRMNQNRANFMRHHQHVGNPMLMPTYGNGLFPVAALNYPSGPLGRMGHFPVSPNYEECMYEGMALNHSRIHYSLYPYVRHGYSPCKRKGGQIRFNNSQTGQLEKAFVQQKYLNATDRKKLAQSLGLTDRQVKTWFQNRRAKYRKCKGTHDIETESEMIESPQNPRDGSPGYHCNSVRTDSPVHNDD